MGKNLVSVLKTRVQVIWTYFSHRKPKYKSSKRKQHMNIYSQIYNGSVVYSYKMIYAHELQYSDNTAASVTVWFKTK